MVRRSRCSAPKTVRSTWCDRMDTSRIAPPGTTSPDCIALWSGCSSPGRGLRQMRLLTQRSDRVDSRRMPRLRGERAACTQAAPGNEIEPAAAGTAVMQMHRAAGLDRPHLRPHLRGEIAAIEKFVEHTRQLPL